VKLPRAIAVLTESQAPIRRWLPAISGFIIFIGFGLGALLGYLIATMIGIFPVLGWIGGMVGGYLLSRALLRLLYSRFL
jgi:hypothetical protein